MNEEKRKLIIKLDRLKRRLAMAKTYMQLTQGELYEETVKTADRLQKQFEKLGGNEKLEELLKEFYILRAGNNG